MVLKETKINLSEYRFCPRQDSGSENEANWELKRASLFCVIEQRVAVISYRRFETTYRSHLQGSRMQKQYSSLRNDPEELSSGLLRGGSLKSCMET